jgi:HEAT repeat protein
MVAAPVDVLEQNARTKKKSDGKNYSKLEAALKLRDLGKEAAPAFPTLLKHVTDGDEKLRQACRQAIEAIGITENQIPLLLPLISDKRFWIRDEGRVLLDRVLPRTAKAVSVVVERWPTDRERQREYIFLLSRMGPVAAEAAPQIVNFVVWRATEPFFDNDSDLYNALQKIGAGLTKHLTFWLGDPRPNVRHCVMLALHRLGPAAADAWPAVLQRFENEREEETIRGVAALALVRFNRPEEAAAALVVAFKDQKFGPRVAPLVVHIGKPAVPALVNALKESNVDVRVLCCKTLGDMGGAAVSAAPALEQALSDRDARVRKIAKLALERVRAASGAPR